MKEAQGLLHCLQWCRAKLITQVTGFGDSIVILHQALMQNACRASHLRRIIAAIRAHGAPPARIHLHHVRRGLNTAADALCNWAMDSESLRPASPVLGTAWPCSPVYAHPVCPAQLSPSVVAPGASDSTYHASLWYLVMMDLRAVSHLVTARFVHPQNRARDRNQPPHRHPSPTVTTSARHLASAFDTNTRKDSWVAGRHRHVPRAVFDNISRQAAINNVPFSIDTAFLASPRQEGVPSADLRTLDALVRLPRFGIAGTLNSSAVRPPPITDQTRTSIHPTIDSTLLRILSSRSCAQSRRRV